MSGTNTGSNDRSGFNDNLKINKVHRKQFEQPTFRSREFDKTTPYEQDRLNQTDTRIGQVLQSAKKKDTLESRMKEYLRTAVGRSSWLSAQTVPDKENFTTEKYLYVLKRICIAYKVAFSVQVLNGGYPLYLAYCLASVCQFIIINAALQGFGGQYTGSQPQIGVIYGFSDYS